MGRGMGVRGYMGRGWMRLRSNSASANALGWLTSRVPNVCRLTWTGPPLLTTEARVAEEAQGSCLLRPEGALLCSLRGLCTPTSTVVATGTLQTGVLLLFFWRLLLLFLPSRAEHSERTEELWMLALSKSDSSRSSSSLCGCRGGPCEPRASPGGSSPGFAGLGRGWGRAQWRLQRHSAVYLWFISSLHPARKPSAHRSSLMAFHPPQALLSSPQTLPTLSTSRTLPGPALHPAKLLHIPQGEALRTPPPRSLPRSLPNETCCTALCQVRPVPSACHWLSPSAHAQTLPDCE